MPISENRGGTSGPAWSRHESLAGRGGEPPARPRCGAGGAQVLPAFFAKTVRKR